MFHRWWNHIRGDCAFLQHFKKHYLNRLIKIEHCHEGNISTREKVKMINLGRGIVSWGLPIQVIQRISGDETENNSKLWNLQRSFTSQLNYFSFANSKNYLFLWSTKAYLCTWLFQSLKPFPVAIKVPALIKKRRKFSFNDLFSN